MKNDLIPFFIRIEDEPKVFAYCSKLLLLLTQPLECFVGGGGGEGSSGVVFHTKEMLRDAKEEVYRHPAIVKTLFREINGILDHCGNFAPSTEDVDVINNCLLILRNVLHINEEDRKPHHDDVFLLILQAGFQDLFKRLVEVGGCRHWTVSIVQLLSLLFKDATSVALMVELTISDENQAEGRPRFTRYAQQHSIQEEKEGEENEEEEDEEEVEEGSVAEQDFSDDDTESNAASDHMIFAHNEDVRAGHDASMAMVSKKAHVEGLVEGLVFFNYYINYRTT